MSIRERGRRCGSISAPQHTATRYNILQDTATYCNILQHTSTSAQILVAQYRAAKMHRVP